MPISVAVNANVAVTWPEGKVNLAGTVPTAGTLETRSTVMPPAVAGYGSVIVNVLVKPLVAVTVAGLSVN